MQDESLSEQPVSPRKRLGLLPLFEGRVKWGDAKAENTAGGTVEVAKQ